MTLKTKRQTIDNIELISTELEFCAATDLLADMGAAVAPAGASLYEKYATRGEALGVLAREVAGGRLTAFLVRLLAGTTMIVREGKGEKIELLASREKLNEAFNGRKKYVFPAVKLALEVSFADFLDGLKLVGIAIPKVPTPKVPTPTMTPSSFEDSIPSTDGTG